MVGIKFIELFAAIGGFRKGLEKANNKFKCVWANEIDKYACQIYRKNFGKEELYEGDIRTVDASEIPDHDLLTGGFPCQPFSVAGKRKGFEDTRGTIFFDIARILYTKRPKYFILENVKGLLSHDNGNTFRYILWILDELGYDVQWQVLNSKDYGVPQNRERVFIVGHLRGERRPEVFPIRNSNKEINQEKSKRNISGTISTKNQSGQCNFDRSTTLIEITKNQSREHRVYDPNGIASTLAGEAGGVGAKTGLYMVSRPHGFNKGGERAYPNVRNSAIQNELIGNIRRLTPIECERLQGFPDNWTEGVSDTQRYKMLGNAVTTTVITEIGRRINETI